MIMNSVKEMMELPIPEAPPVTSADKPGLISIATVLTLLQVRSVVTKMMRLVIQSIFK